MVKKHLTFGHGIHACIGRELARSEIRIVLREFILRTENLKIVGDAPFIASMFAHTLQKLPVALMSSAAPLRIARRKLVKSGINTSNG